MTLPQGGQLSGNKIYFPVRAVLQVTALTLGQHAQAQGAAYDDHAGGGAGAIDYDSQRGSTPGELEPDTRWICGDILLTDENDIETKVMTMDGEVHVLC